MRSVSCAFSACAAGDTVLVYPGAYTTGGAAAPGAYTYKLVEWTTDGQQNTVGVYPLAIASPVRITTCVREGNQLRLAWTGGVPPYSLEKCTHLSPTGRTLSGVVADQWVGVALVDPLASTVLLPINAEASVFFRVCQQP